MTLSLLAIALLLQAAPGDAPRRVSPVLFFPEPGMDDTAAYQGYETRFYRDSKSNTVQIYLDRRSGREVLLWADALDESAGFTARDAQGKPARLDWDGGEAMVADSGGTRSITYPLSIASPTVTLGWFLLGTMRVERDFQYAGAQLRPFTAPPFIVAPESLLVANVERLPAPEQDRQLALLGAGSVAELRSRLSATLVLLRTDTTWTVRVDGRALDGRSRLTVDVTGDSRTSDARVSARTVSIRTHSRNAVHFTVRVTTNGTALTPLSRDEIFNRPFLDYLAQAKSAGDSSDRYRRLERQVRSVELLSSGEKLMAGLPNYATYFGRDGLVTALMMRSIWTPAMSERVIASVLGKLAPTGDVSHEEALGEQAIREHADEYNATIAEYFRLAREGSHARADSALTVARDVLRHLRRVRENYHMMDDEFQLPILEARYMSDGTVPAARKRAFLFDTASGGTTHLALMLREMALVAIETQPFAKNPIAIDLVSFVKRDSTHWRSASWRDSDVGYANGRFAMDINAIWAPRALEAIASTISSLHSLGYTNQALDSIAPDIALSPLHGWLTDSLSLDSTIATWQRARRLFTVSLGPVEIARHIRAKLAWLPQAERAYWQKSLTRSHAGRDSLVFLALSLDARGVPIPVVNTDPATELFLNDYSSRMMNATERATAILQEVDPFMRDYPVGLFVNRVGPVVANDAYASRAVWEEFRREPYHSPRVVWGREVNLFLLGLAEQISSSFDSSGRLKDPALAPYVDSLRTALEHVRSAVAASGVQHNELWSYRIAGDKLLPTRYGTSSDVQLWSTTDLAVQFALSRLPHR
jgi:hypothetical protein